MPRAYSEVTERLQDNRFNNSSSTIVVSHQRSLLTNAGQEVVVVDGAEVGPGGWGARAALFQSVQRVADGRRVVQRRERRPYREGAVGREKEAAPRDGLRRRPAFLRRRRFGLQASTERERGRDTHATRTKNAPPWTRTPLQGRHVEVRTW